MKKAIDNRTTAFHVGGWLVEPPLNRVSKSGSSATVENKVMDVLVYLAAHAGHVVSSKELVEAVWEGRPMGESPVYKIVAALRKTLGDDPKSPRYIETITKKGYRLVAAVTPGAKASGETARRHGLFALVATVLVATVVLWWINSNDRVVVDPVPEKPSVAVIPFDDLSGEPSFSKGLSEDILNALAQVQGLLVSARTSSFAFQGLETDTKTLASKLGVNHILKGNIRHENGRVRVFAQLIDANTGFQVWSDQFDRELKDVFAIQEDIARLVAMRLEVSLIDDDPLVAIPTDNLEAYQLYLLGRSYHMERGPVWWRSAAQYLRQAIELDPQFAAAHARLAMVYLLTPPQEIGDRYGIAGEAYNRALSLDPNNADALAAKGLHLQHTLDFEASAKVLRRAVALNPELVVARQWLSSTLNGLGRYDESRQVLETALVIDPLNPVLVANFANRLAWAGAYDDAKATMERLLGLPQPPPMVYDVLSHLEYQFGRIDTALAIELDAYRNVPGDAKESFLHRIATSYARLGAFDDARVWLPMNQKSGRTPEKLNRLVWKIGVLLLENDTEGANIIADEALRRSGEFGRFHQAAFGSALARVGRYEEATDLLRPFYPEGKTLNAQRWPSALEVDFAHSLVLSYRKLGKHAVADKVIEMVDDYIISWKATGMWRDPQSLSLEARTLAMKGDTNAAVELLSAAVSRGWCSYYEISGDPRWAALADSPEFHDVLERMRSCIGAQRDKAEIARPFAAHIPPLTAMPVSQVAAVR